jgi:alpha-beta hydrolase superfamily lysophospholipase
MSAEVSVMKNILTSIAAIALLTVATAVLPLRAADSPAVAAAAQHPTLYKTIEVNGFDIFYREAGPKDKPTILLLHGYPTSSHMFRNLITDLSSDYHVLAPDYPGYGRSEQPPIATFDYTFDNIALIVE